MRVAALQKERRAVESQVDKVDAPVRPASQARAPHIVDVLIEERARKLRDSPLAWALIRAFLYPLLRYRDALAMADRIAGASALESFEYVTQLLDLQLDVKGLEHVPRQGACLLVSNHPTGIADGLALYQALKGVRDDLRYFANRDALRVSPGLAEKLIPVEWLVEKRSLAKTREMWREARHAFRREQMVVMFPSGRVAQRIDGKLVDRPWHDTTITIARRNAVPIVPLHMVARNSWLYYFFNGVRQELRDMTLFNELFNKRGKTFKLTFGPPISPEQVPDEPEVEIQRLRRYIEEDLPVGRFWRC